MTSNFNFNVVTPINPYFKNKIGCIKDLCAPQEQSHTSVDKSQIVPSQYLLHNRMIINHIVLYNNDYKKK